MKDTVSLVFDSVFIREMFIDLNMNTKNVLGGLEPNDDDQEQYAQQDLFDISSFITFRKLKEFTEQSRH